MEYTSDQRGNQNGCISPSKLTNWQGNQLDSSMIDPSIEAIPRRDHHFPPVPPSLPTPIFPYSTMTPLDNYSQRYNDLRFRESARHHSAFPYFLTPQSYPSFTPNTQDTHMAALPLSSFSSQCYGFSHPWDLQPQPQRQSQPQAYFGTNTFRGLASPAQIHGLQVNVEDLFGPTDECAADSVADKSGMSSDSDSSDSDSEDDPYFRPSLTIQTSVIPAPAPSSAIVELPITPPAQITKSTTSPQLTRSGKLSSPKKKKGTTKRAAPAARIRSTPTRKAKAVVLPPTPVSLKSSGKSRRLFQRNFATPTPAPARIPAITPLSTRKPPASRTTARVLMSTSTAKQRTAKAAVSKLDEPPSPDIAFRSTRSSTATSFNPSITTESEDEYSPSPAPIFQRKRPATSMAKKTPPKKAKKGKRNYGTERQSQNQRAQKKYRGKVKLRAELFYNHSASLTRLVNDATSLKQVKVAFAAMHRRLLDELDRLDPPFIEEIERKIAGCQG